MGDKRSPADVAGHCAGSILPWSSVRIQEGGGICREIGSSRWVVGDVEVMAGGLRDSRAASRG